MKVVLLALSLLFALTAFSLIAPTGNAQPQLGSCSQLTTKDCYYMLCVGDYQNQYGYYECKYAIYWPCQYCVPLV